MEVTATSTTGQARQDRWADFRLDLRLLLLLVLLAASLRTWTLTHTEVTARDSIGFIRYALQFEQLPLTEVLRGNHQHPVYAALILLVSWPLRAWTGVTNSHTMQLSAQLASSFAGVLLVIPMFYLGKALFQRRVGFWAAALFQCLPVSGRVLGDALSEGPFLCLLATALLTAVHALRNNSWLLGGLCGVLIGLTYLTRPEGGLLLPVAGTVLLTLQLVHFWHRSWLRTLACGTALIFGTVLVGSPFVYVLGRLTPKPTPSKMFGVDSQEQLLGVRPPRVEPVQLATAGHFLPGLPLFAERWQGWAFDRAFVAVGKETLKGFHYLGWLPALPALWWFRGRFSAQPGTWVLPLLCLLHVSILCLMAMTVRYVSERHVLILVLCGVFWTAAGLDELPRRFAKLRERFPGCLRWAPAALLLLFVAASLPKTLKPLHGNRAGHHAAGRWLAEHADPSDDILDPFCWAHFYAGRVLMEGKPPVLPPPSHQPKIYVVLEDDDLDERVNIVSRARKLAEHGQVVFHWPAHKPPLLADVQVYAVPRAGP